MHAGECHIKWKIENKVMLLLTKEHLKRKQTTRSQKQSIEQTLPHSLRRPQPDQHLDLGRPASATVRQEITMFKPLSLWYSIRAVSGNEYK